MARKAKPAATASRTSRSQRAYEAKGADGGVISSNAPSVPVLERSSHRPRQIRAGGASETAGVPASTSTSCVDLVIENVIDVAEAPVCAPVLAEAAATCPDGVERPSTEASVVEVSVLDPSHCPVTEVAPPDVGGAVSDVPVREGDASPVEMTLEPSEDEDMDDRLKVCKCVCIRVTQALFPYLSPE
jgi:hypothetical protein